MIARIFSGILAFFFSISSFFTVLAGNHRASIFMQYNEERGLVWECKIADDDIAFVYKTSAIGSAQTFTLEGKSEGRTYATLTSRDGDIYEFIFDSTARINPYNGDTEFYYLTVAYQEGEYINYDENVVLTAKNPVPGGYWDFNSNNYYLELKSEPETVNGVCEFDVINPTMEDSKHGVLFTYYDADGTPLEVQFKLFTLTEDGKIEYTPENRIAKIELPSDFSKLIGWTVSEGSLDSEAAEIISIYSSSDTYGDIYFPEDYSNAEVVKQLLNMILGKVPVGGSDTVVIEALKEGTAEFTLEKVDMYPLVKTDDGYEINTSRREVLETKTVTVTVDADLNISYEIK